MSDVERTGIGKKFARAAEKTYTGTDDFGKEIDSYLSMTPDEKN